ELTAADGGRGAVDGDVPVGGTAAADALDGVDGVVVERGVPGPVPGEVPLVGGVVEGGRRRRNGRGVGGAVGSVAVVRAAGGGGDVVPAGSDLPLEEEPVRSLHGEGHSDGSVRVRRALGLRDRRSGRGERETEGGRGDQGAGADGGAGCGCAAQG